MDAFIGEIRAFGFYYAPLDWALCNGQSMSQQQSAALYAVIGQIYGGSGTNFNLPNLQGRAAMDQGAGIGLTTRQVGEAVGVSDVTLTLSQTPAHSHDVKVVTSNASGDAADKADPAGAYWANGIKSGRPPTLSAYLAPGAAKTPAAMSPNTIQPYGNQNPTVHVNMQPYQVINMCICVNGYFPVRP
jgi:microcystin-dependent protein